MDKPSYYGVLPAVVRYADITMGAKILYSELTALTNKYGFSFATNGYFADLYGVSKVTISTWLKALEQKGFVNLVFKHHKRHIFITTESIKSKTKATKKINQYYKAYKISDETACSDEERRQILFDAKKELGRIQ